MKFSFSLASTQLNWLPVVEFSRNFAGVFQVFCLRFEVFGAWVFLKCPKKAWLRIVTCDLRTFWSHSISNLTVGSKSGCCFFRTRLITRRMKVGRVGTPRARPGVARLSQRDHTTTAHHSTEGEGVVLQSQVRPLTLSLFQRFFPMKIELPGRHLFAPPREN